MNCDKCGGELEEGARFCGSCGQQVEGAVIPRAAERKYGKTIFQGSGAAVQSQPKPRSAPEALLATVAASRPPTPQKPAVAAPSAQRPAAVPLDASNLVGATINGRYRVESLIGEGGFGTVWKGVQLQMERECALKVLHPKMARDQQVVGRFRREAQAASVLKAAHTVQIYDFDQTPDGIFYLAMELLHGRSLHGELQSGALPPKRVAHILDGIAESLGEAHSHNIVHRDIKPENIFLETRGADTDYVKVLDFGIAKITSQESGPSRGPALTAAGQTLGTLEYMSPEQLMGMPLDGRSDLYAIGILAFEMLTGDLPFPVKTSGEMISAHLKTAPPPPSKIAPDRGIPPLADQIVLRLLEKDRNRRYRDTAEMQADLKRLAAQLEQGTPMIAPVPAPPVVVPSAVPAYATRRAQKTGPSPAKIALIAGVVIAFLGVLAAVGLLINNAHGAEGPPPPARLVPATMGAVVGVDVAAIRAQSPSAAVSVLEDALRVKLAEVGADPTKLGRAALGVDVTNAQRPPAVLVVDASMDPRKLDEAIKKNLKPGEKLAPVSYKGQKYKKSGEREYALLPGDRLVFTNGTGLQNAIDLQRGSGASLVEGPAAKLLESVGAAGGKGPALFYYSLVTDEMRRDFGRQAPQMATVQESAGALTLAPSGADLTAVGRCGTDGDAKAAADGLRAMVEQAKRDQTMSLLGLAPILQAVKVDSQGALVRVTLHLSAEQYGDLFTRFTGLLASAAAASHVGPETGAPPAQDKPATPAKKKPAKKAATTK